MSEIKTPPMRLVDLHPKWIMTSGGEVYGIAYDCPCGLPSYDPSVPARPYADCCPSGGRQIVPTRTSFTGIASCPSSVEKGWDVAGDSFVTITLSPSIHQVGHWHGFLRAGWLESC